jgi:RNA polymerase sigma factor (sigma-70 family)
MASWQPLLEELLSTRRARIQAYATLLAGASLADDLVQEALIATFSKNRGIKSVNSAEAYVKRAIATKYLDSVRKDRAERIRMERTATTESVPDHAAQIDGAQLLDAALATLPPRVRACVVLRYLEDQSTRDTAATLGLSQGAVKRYLADGIASLNGTLGTRDQLENIPTTTTVLPINGGAS